MKPPEVNAVVEIEHRGKRTLTMVESVEPDPVSSLLHWIWLHVIEPRGSFRKGEPCAWIREDGSKLPLQLHDVVNEEGDVGLLVRARFFSSGNGETASSRDAFARHGDQRASAR